MFRHMVQSFETSDAPHGNDVDMALVFVCGEPLHIFSFKAKAFQGV